MVSKHGNQIIPYYSHDYSHDYSQLFPIIPLMVIIEEGPMVIH